MTPEGAEKLAQEVARMMEAAVACVSLESAKRRVVATLLEAFPEEPWVPLYARQQPAPCASGKHRFTPGAIGPSLCLDCHWPTLIVAPPGASTPEPGPISQPPGNPSVSTEGSSGGRGSSGFKEWWRAQKWDWKDPPPLYSEAGYSAVRAAWDAATEAAEDERDEARALGITLTRERDAARAEVAKLREQRDAARGFEEDLDVRLTKARNALGRAGVPEVVGAWPGRMLSVAERIEWLDLARPPREDRPPAPPPGDVSKEAPEIDTSAERVDAVNVSPEWSADLRTVLFGASGEAKSAEERVRARLAAAEALAEAVEAWAELNCRQTWETVMDRLSAFRSSGGTSHG